MITKVNQFTHINTNLIIMPQDKTTITINICYYHPDDENGNVDESIKVYDFEGMAEEFENELSKLDDSVVVMCSVSTEDK